MLTEVQKMLMISRGEAAGLDADGVIASGWPWRISQVAAPALHVLNARRRYSEQVVEDVPTGKVIDLHDRRYSPRPADEIAEGTLVGVTVVCHHPYGLGVWVDGVDQFGHVNVPGISDEPIGSPENYPPIGDRLRAVVIGYNGSQQLRLTTRRSDLPGLTARGAEVFEQIAHAVGAHIADVHDEHERWQVYWTAISHEDLRPLIREAISEGEDRVRQIVVETLKYVDEAEGRTWVDLIQSDHDRAFAEQRLREWALIREIADRPRKIAIELPELTLWCQRRIIEHATSDLVLSDVAESGSSKRIRHAAREKLRGRWKGWA
ncbi:hypothetical protein [Myceligenerans salitolerans]|uniref:S1 motif domain-containing protein n=1 Tax=Myceligenerans salitolerans TaxID=1230528 RepID=A0ABS3I7J4_9MICO|nr:hypothetical protein [Myceligenerans salitolerans]MBO0608904.1 hypothetical protein [Myceligenerans salitolerans]